MNRNNKTTNWLIIAFCGVSIISFGIGTGLSNKKYNKNNQEIGQVVDRLLSQKKDKISSLMELIDYEYVDKISIDSLTDIAIEDILAQLDPHSTYIPAKDSEEINSEIEGKFSGIGVQFSIQKDTIMIVDVINGGPSERVGLLPGDRIIAVNDTPFVGKEMISNEKVIHKLRGKKGTTVEIGVRRKGSSEQLNYKITRGDIPIESIRADYLIAPQIGFIALNSNFGVSTYQEFIDAIAQLKSKGAKKFIIDLRNNGGGLLDIAVRMLNEFLPEGSLILKAEGKAYPEKEYLANGTGSCISNPVVVLIDEFSASASEIFAGAIQDNDRGMIIGRRSFGKGLVQTQIPFADGSSVRLTVARYYTPSGRSIQKPYEKGKGLEYEMDLLHRFEHGEFYNQDSIHLADSLQYKTSGGRLVYGGGGIMPDIFVARDTTEYTAYANRVINNGYVHQFAFEYTDKHRDELKAYSTWEEMDKYLSSKGILDKLVTFAQQKGIPRNGKDLQISGKLLQNEAQQYIVRNMLGDDAYVPMVNSRSKEVKKAVDILKHTEEATVVE